MIFGRLSWAAGEGVVLCDRNALGLMFITQSTLPHISEEEGMKTTDKILIAIVAGIILLIIVALVWAIGQFI